MPEVLPTRLSSPTDKEQLQDDPTKMKLSRSGRTLYLFPVNDVVKTYTAKDFGFEPQPNSPNHNRWTCSYNEALVMRMREHMLIILDRNLKAMCAKQTSWDNVEPTILPSKRKPFKHQAIGNTLLLTKRRFMLAWEMGVGKSKPITDVSTYLLNTGTEQLGKADYCIIFTSKSIINTWHIDSLPKDTDMPSIKLTGSELQRKSDFRKGIKQGVKIFITNYAATRMSEFMELLKTACSQKTIIVLDESHNVKSIHSQQTVQMYHLISGLQVYHVFAATGTPASQSPEDIFGQFAMLDVRLFGAPREEYQFRANYVEMSSQNRNVVLGYKNLDHWMVQFNKAAYRLTKEDAKLNLPPLIEQIVQFELPPSLRKLYDKFVASGVLTTDHKNELYQTFVSEHPMTMYSWAQQMVNNWKYISDDPGITRETIEVNSRLDMLDNPKLEWIKEFLEGTDAQGIIYYEFHGERSRLSSLLTSMNIPFTNLRGGLTDNQRNKTISDFQNNQAQVFLCQTGSGSEGINLQNAHFVIYFTHPRKVTQFIQSQSRAHRMGLDHPVNQYHLLYERTIEISKYQTLVAKLDLSTVITSGSPEVVRDVMLGELSLTEMSKHVHI